MTGEELKKKIKEILRKRMTELLGSCHTDEIPLTEEGAEAILFYADEFADALIAAGIGDVKESDNVNHPPHYGGEDNPYEAIKVIEAWNLGFCLGNAVKYISRAGKKDKSKTTEDLEKAVWYLQREINKLKGENK